MVAAHPDDEVLGCGATIAKHVAQGDTVQVLILGEGINAREGLMRSEKLRQQKHLYNSAIKANKALGVERLILKKLPDNKFDSIPLLEIVQLIEKNCAEFKPEIIYTHHCGDVNIDHRRTAEAVEVATRPIVGTSIEIAHSFEIPSSTEWNFAKPDIFRPNVFVDVTDYLKKKMEALVCYRSELREFPHPRSLEYIAALAKVRGGQSGFSAAEAFSLLYWRKGTS